MKKVTLKEKMVEERYGPRIFPSPFFGPTKRARFSPLMVSGEGGGVAVV